MTDPKKPRPAKIGDFLAGFLEESGMAHRVEQASVLPEWPALVGPKIAAVTEPRAVSSDGTLLVWVKTNAWMNELSLMEPELLRALNGRAGQTERSKVRRIRWQLGDLKPPAGKG
ncbi:MAG TPA: DUF721 domain-containing protein [Gemmatimonadaceae bacterium]